MSMNFWYPAEESRKLTAAPLKRQILGLWFGLWRDGDGRARYVHNTFTHRGRVAYPIPSPARRRDPQNRAVTALPVLQPGE